MQLNLTPPTFDILFSLSVYRLETTLIKDRKLSPQHIERTKPLPCKSKATMSTPALPPELIERVIYWAVTQDFDRALSGDDDDANDFKATVDCMLKVSNIVKSFTMDLLLQYFS